MIAGASVEVSAGAFAGHRAKVITASRDWVKLLMTFFGRDAEVVVARNAVETV
jgi:transcription antitermination factor NusG